MGTQSWIGRVARIRGGRAIKSLLVVNDGECRYLGRWSTVVCAPQDTGTPCRPAAYGCCYRLFRPVSLNRPVNPAPLIHLTQPTVHFSIPCSLARPPPTAASEQRPGVSRCVWTGSGPFPLALCVAPAKNT